MTERFPLSISEHPHLDARAFTTELPSDLADIPSPAWLTALLSREASAPFAPDESVRSAVRDLLRTGGFKPSGRSKPASEYLQNAASEAPLRSINALVDVCNVVSLHSGLPISVIDLDRATSPFRIAIADSGTKYIFNAGGQEIDVGQLWCLFDADGPCANAVKDAQRTKTQSSTRRTLTVLWGPAIVADRVESALLWYRELLERLGAFTRGIPDEHRDAFAPLEISDEGSTWVADDEPESAADDAFPEIPDPRHAIRWQGEATLTELGERIPYVADLSIEHNEWHSPNPPSRSSLVTTITVGPISQRVSLRLAHAEAETLRLGRSFFAGKAYIDPEDSGR